MNDTCDQTNPFVTWDEVRAYVSRLWSADWDSPEDSACDEEAE